MTLLTAPKAESSWFRPVYHSYSDNGTPDNIDDDYMDMGMGEDIVAKVTAYNPDGTIRFIMENDSVKVENGYAKTEMEEQSLYRLYKSGNNVKYGELGELVQEEIDYEYDGQNYKVDRRYIQSLAEATVYIGTDAMNKDGAWERSRIEYMTFEDAVKGIDSLNNKNEKYCIVLNGDVEIGNAKGDYKYSALALPSKASSVTVWGEGNSIVFSGNLTIRCNTTFACVNLVPVKLVNKMPVEAVINVSVGNNTMAWRWSDVCKAELCEEGLAWYHDGDFGFGNITGSNKSGTLIVCEDSVLKANNITGFKTIELLGNSVIAADGNVTTKDLAYEGADGRLDVGGNITIDNINVNGNCHAEIVRASNKTMKVNGKVTVNCEEALKISVITNMIDGKDMVPGTKIMTGKYLNPEDWYIVSSVDEENQFVWIPYMSGNDLCVGTDSGQ